MAGLALHPRGAGNTLQWTSGVVKVVKTNDKYSMGNSLGQAVLLSCSCSHNGCSPLAFTTECQLLDLSPLTSVSLDDETDSPSCRSRVMKDRICLGNFGSSIFKCHQIEMNRRTLALIIDFWLFLFLLTCSLFFFNKKWLNLLFHMLSYFRNFKKSICISCTSLLRVDAFYAD